MSSPERRKFTVTCIICPLSCEIEVEMEGDKIVKITGYKCPRGEEYAREEATCPKRVIMSVVKCVGGDFPTVSVKTDKPIPKEKIFDVMKELSKVEVKAPVEIGDVILENVLGLGVNIVATRPCKKI